MSEYTKYVCIHGHFYQPPRENAWLETIEYQDSAAPFHDWNERINFECYAPNSSARMLDEEARIIDIVNNYARISFNFGPTLLSWMEKADPVTYQNIIDADRLSQELYQGHGSAMAQVYNHMIMPLANARDKDTQVYWGIRDFKRRFGRRPTGMWLAETAVDTDSLETLARYGIEYTVLAPRQAKAIRKIGASDWQKLPPDSVDPRRPYLCPLPSGRSIALFFYDGGRAQEVAFKGLLNNGRHFAERLMDGFDPIDPHPQLVHIATDGESYGHHHRFGEMALAACLRTIDETPGVALTNYAAYLDKFPPEYEVMIHENSSWSCVHGVERWRSDCGCNTGGRPGWTQAWRQPLREALDWLRDKVVNLYNQQAEQLVQDPWGARNEYIRVILDRSPENVDRFIAEHAKNNNGGVDVTQILRLLEMQRHAMLMYTSCGWFFDEISGIETNQILQYAHRAIHYAKQVSGVDLKEKFVTLLEKAPSNLFENGAESYLQHVVPSSVDLFRVGMHYAATSLFEDQPENMEFLNYSADSEVYHRYQAGDQRLALGRTVVRSKITRSEKTFSFAALHLGQQNVIGKISLQLDRHTFDQMVQEILQAYKRTDLGQVIEIMLHYFGERTFSIWQLFTDEKHRILQDLTQRNLGLIETAFREIYNDNYQLMTSFLNSDLPVPEAFRSAVEFIINHDLLLFFTNGTKNIRDLLYLSEEIRKWRIRLTNEAQLQLSISEYLFQAIQGLDAAEDPAKKLAEVNQVLETLQGIDLEVNFWKSQNSYFSLYNRLRAEGKLTGTHNWEPGFYQLGNLLNLKLQEVTV